MGVRAGLWGGSAGRFFTFAWDRCYAETVTETIDDYYKKTQLGIDEDFQTVPKILARLKGNLNEQPIDPSDDLAKILQVVNEKTGVNYDDVTAEVKQQVVKTGVGQ